MDHQRIHARPTRDLGQITGFFNTPANASQHRHAATHEPGHGLHHGLAFAGPQGIVFAGIAVGDQQVHACGYGLVNNGAQPRWRYGAFGIKGGDEDSGYSVQRLANGSTVKCRHGENSWGKYCLDGGSPDDSVFIALHGGRQFGAQAGGCWTFKKAALQNRQLGHQVFVEGVQKGPDDFLEDRIR